MRPTKAAWRLSLVPVLGVLALPATAGAQAQASGSEKVAAQALFEDGRRLAAGGKFADACPKFAESQRLDPSPSTLLNLASCWERLGRTATAWATFREAESAASAAKRQEYVDTAERHARALAPTLARLVLAVQQPIEGMQVRRDGVVVGSVEWGSAIPVDAGTHKLEASAPGYKVWTASVEVPRDGAQVSITVPVLEAVPTEPPPLPPPPATSGLALPPPTTPQATPRETPSDGSTQRLLGGLVAGAGAVGLGVSGVFAVIANGKKQDSIQNCHLDNPNVCKPDGLSQRNDALSAGNTATVAFAIGAGALVAGGVLWFVAPKGGPSSGAARLILAPTLGGAVVRGTW